MKGLGFLLGWFGFLTTVLKVQLTLLESRAAQHCRRVALGNCFGAGTRGLDPGSETPPFRLCLLPSSFFPHIFSHLKLSCVYMGGGEHRKDGQIQYNWQETGPYVV